MPLLTLFQLYRGGQFYWWMKPDYPEENHKPSASHIILHRGHFAMNWIQTRNFRCDRHRLHRQLYIQLPYDDDHDGPSLIIIHVKYFNINLIHHMASRHKKYISLFNLFSGTRHNITYLYLT